MLCRRTHHLEVARQRLKARLRLHIDCFCKMSLHKKCTSQRSASMDMPRQRLEALYMKIDP